MDILIITLLTLVALLVVTLVWLHEPAVDPQELERLREAGLHPTYKPPRND